MADISSITLPDGVTYDIKDTVARAAVSGQAMYKIVSQLPTASADTLNVIYLIKANKSSYTFTPTGQEILNFKNAGSSSRTHKGITYTIENGVVTATGTATGGDSYCPIGNTLTLENNIVYRLSGCPDAGSSSSYYLRAYWTTNYNVYSNDYGKGITFKIQDNKVNRDIEILIKSGTTVNDLKFVPILEKGTVDSDFYYEYMTIRSGTAPSYTYSWELLGSTNTDLSDYSKTGHVHTVTSNVAVAAHTITPAGTISQPIFTGTAATLQVTGTPSGTVSQPSFTGSAVNVNVSGTATGSVSTPTVTVAVTDNSDNTLTPYSMSSTGSYTASQWTAGSYTASSYTPAIFTVNNEELVITASSYTAESVTMPSYTAESVTMPSRTQMNISATATQPTFTGTAFTSSGTVTAAGSVSQPTFTGSALTSTGSYTPAGTVSQPTFTGTETTFNHNVTNNLVISGQNNK